MLIWGTNFGSLGRLKILVSNSVHSLIRVSGPSFLSPQWFAGAPAWTDIGNANSPVWFGDASFSLPTKYDIMGLAVHEAFHLINYNFESWGKGLNYNPVRSFPRTANLSPYARQNNLNLEYWGEAGADWVYGAKYSSLR